ncbi:hypothetical protein DHEL01_v206176 [Diaporthe helianthi]|uniref:Wax synthase domain-containing protein n=1 Tax=Diaporthe helianthi TaxID=158607 RepID=A0A2P5HYV0_DIAHE|nr:hypothetical protein DHEL01_v206176 [Diaporthe helianthi]
MWNKVAITLHVFSLISQLLLLSAPTFAFRRALVVLCITIPFVAVHFVGPASDVPGDAQPFTLLWPIYLGTLDKVLCANGDGPEDSYWRKDRLAREARAFKAFGISKLKWAAAMMFNTRGVRWSFEVKNLPASRPMSKSSFLLRQAIQFAKMLLMSDLFLQLSTRLLWTPPESPGSKASEPGAVSWQDSKALTISHSDWRWSFLKVLVFAAGPYFFVKLQYVTASIVAVGLNMSQVEDWPPYFGNVNNVTTVRYFWGTFWHQTLRRSFTKFTGFVINTIGIARGTNLSSYTQIWLAFVASGLMHAQSMLLLPHPPNITVSERTLGVLAFFLWQAAAITIEDLFQWLYRRTYSGFLSQRAMNVIGYAWVIVSFWISLPWAGNVMMRLRLTEKSFLGFSLFENMMQRIAVPP